MIDPISAFGLAANILQFIEVGYNVTVLFHQLLEASATDENLEIETIAQDMNDICVNLAVTSGSAVPMSKGEKMLQTLAKKGEKLAKELDTILKGLVVRSQGSKRRVEVLQKSLKVLLRGKKVKALQTRLAELRDQMVIRMVSVLEYGFQHTKVKMQANAIVEMASPMSA
jgi:phospholipid N-methyltransferase